MTHFKVICIAKENGPGIIPGPTPKVGEIYTVIRAVTGYDAWDFPQPAYEIAELFPNEWCYDQKLFAVLSDLDETKLATIRKQDEIYH
jgi:hypothetical protein